MSAVQKFFIRLKQAYGSEQDFWESIDEMVSLIIHEYQLNDFDQWT